MRRRLPPPLDERFEAFRMVVERIESGKEALLSSVPTTRLPGRPLAETLLAFERALVEAEAGMAAWRAEEVEEEWRSSSAGLAAARSLAERIRLEAPEPEGFEALVGTIGDLLAPLDPFGTALERFGRLRIWRR